jgi:group II intron reverse transcriptase/maturase
MGLDGVREVARRDRRARFTALLHHITPLLLVESFYALRRNAAPGVDGVTWREYEEILYTRVHELHREIHTGTYRAQPSRRVYIPKADSRQRPLGISSLEDKIVQQAVSTVLSAIYEEDFLGFSYGFRVGRGQHDALDALYMGIKSRKVNWILDLDIRAFFDEISHEWLVKFLEHRIADKRLLRLIRQGLKAGVIEDGRRVVSDRGCPRVSAFPDARNIYLHYASISGHTRWRKGTRATSSSCGTPRYRAGLPARRRGRRFLAAVQERLGKFGLALNTEKTRLIEFGRYATERRRQRKLGKPETFDFLGFTHCCSRSKRGAFEVLRVTVKKRMRATLAAIRETLLRRRHEPVAAVGRWLGQVVRGYYNYFAVPGNIYRLNGFRAEVERAWLHALRRRGQRSRMPWSRFRRFVDRFLPLLRLVHRHPLERLRVTT